jgi:hypothetical protein
LVLVKSLISAAVEEDLQALALDEQLVGVPLARRVERGVAGRVSAAWKP